MPVRTSSSTPHRRRPARTARSHGSLFNDPADSFGSRRRPRFGGSRRSSSCSRSSPIPPGRSNARGRVCVLGTTRRQAQQKRAAREDIEAPSRRSISSAPCSGRRRPNTSYEGSVAVEHHPRLSRKPSTALLRLLPKDSTNKEIAAALYMGASTVEAHLSRVYRKLGIRSRVGLKDALAVDAAAVNTRDGAAEP